MKTISLSLLLIISSAILTAQDVLIIKKANTIIITDSLSRDSLYNKIADLLFESGYGILNTDKVQGIITTTEKSFKNGVVKLNFLIKDQKVVLRGDYKDNLTIDLGGVSQGPSWNVINFAGQKNSINRSAWDEMYKISEQIPGKKEYVIK